PNPIKDLAFMYEISIPVKSSTSYIELISSSGQKMGQFPVTENTGKINLPANTANGMYSLRLFVNNKNYATAKIIIAGE
ncbi:MAG: T9SS type A sorting domain-containing protein, partial [Paludibacter sp.]|nr:T9SS type A sorting domain-containing protein [Paludibacter sp.]